MARASIDTLLSLDRWASVIGYAPPAFNGSVSNIIFPGNVACRTIFQHPWQDHDAVSREEIAREIAMAEQDIANYLGWWPAPRWIAQDVKMYPRFHRPEYYSGGGVNVRYQMKSLKTTYGKIIEPGQRAVTYIGTAEAEGVPCSKTFSDEDDDDFDETVTVSCTGVTTTDECEIKVYFVDHNGDPEWEIRPPRTREIVDGTFTATFWAWQLIDPNLWETLPTHVEGGTPAVNLDDPVSFVTEVDIYREYNDPTATSAVLYWEPDPSSLSGNICGCGGAGCVHCTLTTQNGCATIRNAELGYLTAAPGTYDEDEGIWTSDAWSVCRDPDEVKLYYYCGNLSELNRAGRRCIGLSDQWARIIAWLATARLRRPLCDCSGVSSLVDWLQTDLALATRESTYTVIWDDLSNPFGTKIGEMEAYRHCRALEPGKISGAGAVR
ncbi:MAG: hypothetical protein AMJ93_14635 [Anaerolineae bacterium SM23_84]|nr:MAG: hypothetical protein AMJ93_14635 [Anaerolineae bacterium SM23_84]